MPRCHARLSAYQRRVVTLSIFNADFEQRAKSMRMRAGRCAANQLVGSVARSRQNELMVRHGHRMPALSGRAYSGASIANEPTTPISRRGQHRRRRRERCRRSGGGGEGQASVIIGAAASHSGAPWRRSIIGSIVGACRWRLRLPDGENRRRQQRSVVPAGTRCRRKRWGKLSRHAAGCSEIRRRRRSATKYRALFPFQFFRRLQRADSRGTRRFGRSRLFGIMEI